MNDRNINLTRGQLFVGKYKETPNITALSARLGPGSLNSWIVDKENKQIYFNTKRTRYTKNLQDLTKDLWEDSNSLTRTDKTPKDLKAEHNEWDYFCQREKARVSTTISELSFDTDLPSTQISEPTPSQGFSYDTFKKIVLTNVQLDALITFFDHECDITNKYNITLYYERLKDLEHWQSEPLIVKKDAIKDLLETVYNYKLSDESLLLSEWRKRSQNAPQKETSLIATSKKIQKTVKDINGLTPNVSTKESRNNRKPALLNNLPDVVIRHFNKVITLSAVGNIPCEQVNRDIITKTPKMELGIDKSSLHGHFAKSFNDYILNKCT